MATPQVAPKGNGKVLPDLTAMQAEIERLTAENARLAASQKSGGKISMKIGPKGGISVYGLQRNPVTLYIQQWERFIPWIKEGHLEAFAAENADKLTRK